MMISFCPFSHLASIYGSSSDSCASASASRGSASSFCSFGVTRTRRNGVARRYPADGKTEPTKCPVFALGRPHSAAMSPACTSPASVYFPPVNFRICETFSRGFGSFSMATAASSFDSAGVSVSGGRSSTSSRLTIFPPNRRTCEILPIVLSCSI